MQIRINKEWVIYTTKNALGIILGKIPEDKQNLEFDPMKSHIKHHYVTIFGAINGLFKYAIADSEAKSLLELEQYIQSIATQCEKAFNQFERGQK